jgi:hypothetical protein
MKTRRIQGLGASMLAGALALAGPAQAMAEERWQFDDERGDWVLVGTPDREAAAAPQPWRKLDAPAANEDAPLRSGLAIAGGVVLTSVGALPAALGGMSLLYEAGKGEEDPLEYAPAAGVTLLGLAAIGGGVALMVWGGRRDAPTVAIAVAPDRVGLTGSF